MGRLNLRVVSPGRSTIRSSPSVGFRGGQGWLHLCAPSCCFGHRPARVAAEDRHRHGAHRFALRGCHRAEVGAGMVATRSVNGGRGDGAPAVPHERKCDSQDRRVSPSGVVSFKWKRQLSRLIRDFWTPGTRQTFGGQPGEQLVLVVMWMGVIRQVRWGNVPGTIY